MLVEKDYEDLLRLFNKNKVRYCIVGAFALGFYTKPRYCKDIDILIEPSFENGERIVKALEEFGFGSLRLKVKDFIKERQIIQLGYEPERIDLITSIKGLDFKAVWRHKRHGIYGKQKVYFIGLDELIKSKRSSKRKQDQADLENLLRLKRR